MEEVFRTIAAVTALGIEAAVIATVVLGAIEALVHLLRTLFTGSADNWTRAIWLRFAGWIILALEFALGADIIRTAIAPQPTSPHSGQT